MGCVGSSSPRIYTETIRDTTFEYHDYRNRDSTKHYLDPPILEKYLVKDGVKHMIRKKFYYPNYTYVQSFYIRKKTSKETKYSKGSLRRTYWIDPTTNTLYREDNLPSTINYSETGMIISKVWDYQIPKNMPYKIIYYRSGAIRIEYREMDNGYVHIMGYNENGTWNHEIIHDQFNNLVYSITYYNCYAVSSIKDATGRKVWYKKRDMKISPRYMNILMMYLIKISSKYDYTKINDKNVLGCIKEFL